ncbi:MAG: hypothetical protein IPP64_11805 [Bacteroidetes bacterium]|nr:hypothetical protein [Bacteroidota bacterium]
MEQEPNQSGPDFILPLTDEVKEINEIAFRNHAKIWAYSNAFLPVIRKLENNTLFLTLYYDSYRNRDIRQIEELCATYYREEFPGISYSECNVLKIWLDKEVSQEDIIKTNSMEELEKVFIKAIDQKNYNACIPYKGGLTIYALYLDYKFKYWNKLISQGFLEPDYEEKFQHRMMGEFCEVKAKEEKIFPKEENKFMASIHIFHKTGGEQPTNLDPKAINHFFKGNYAKDWAMRLGYIPTFKDYKDGVIHFDIISDPRCEDHDFFLAHFIASEYLKKVTVLKDATNFIANYFKANDIIGFLITSDEKDQLESLKERMDKSYAELPKKPQLVHYGAIPI